MSALSPWTPAHSELRATPSRSRCWSPSSRTKAIADRRWHIALTGSRSVSRGREDSTRDLKSPSCLFNESRRGLSGLVRSIRFPPFLSSSLSGAMRKIYLLIAVAIALIAHPAMARAQQGYEFEVYDTHLKNPGTTELELNTNFVASGPRRPDTGLFPTQNMLRSSFEIGAGLTNWLEGSIYVLAVRRPN